MYVHVCARLTSGALNGLEMCRIFSPEHTRCVGHDEKK